MIALSKLDGSTMYVNEDHVERVEGGARSAVHLTNGQYFVVLDDVDAINERIRAEKVAVLARALHHVGDALGTVPSLTTRRTRDGQP